MFDYGTKTQQELMKIVKENFDLRPGRIVKDLKLKNPIFQQTATYGHFGRKISTWKQAQVLSFKEGRKFSLSSSNIYFSPNTIPNTIFLLV